MTPFLVLDPNISKQAAEDMALKLPKLRAVSLNGSKLGESIVCKDYILPYSMDVSTASHIFVKANSAMSLHTPETKTGSSLRYIKHNLQAWELVERGNRLQLSECGTPKMAVRTLSRTDANVPRIFLVEEIEKREDYWGLKRVTGLSPNPWAATLKPILYHPKWREGGSTCRGSESSGNRRQELTH